MVIHCRFYGTSRDVAVVVKLATPGKRSQRRKQSGVVDLDGSLRPLTVKPPTDSHSSGADIALGWVLCRQFGGRVIFYMDSRFNRRRSPYS
jgi:hypothetical protein